MQNFSNANIIIHNKSVKKKTYWPLDNDFVGGNGQGYNSLENLRYQVQQILTLFTFLLSGSGSISTYLKYRPEAASKKTI